jgi:DNA (cytosine-5)-methyltransferase 1
MSSPNKQLPALSCVGLFAGIGGIELGLRRAGHHASLLCEIDPAARAVLSRRFPGVACHDDVTTLRRFPKGTDLVCAGFPCQDLSQAGTTKGIGGARSGLVNNVFELLGKRGADVAHVLLENVPFMLQLGRGRALEVIIGALEHLGYEWAYRVVDSRAFGLPQRRERVYLLASRTIDPATVLFADQADAPEETAPSLQIANGFYWTEGLRGLGWANGAVPTLKGGSTIGIPSPPAILLPDGAFVKPDIRDAERLQGFPVDWTSPAEQVVKPGFRWKLVGNAVTVRIPEWIGHRLRTPGTSLAVPIDEIRKGKAWPRAAFGRAGKRLEVRSTSYPVREVAPSLENFLIYPPTPLSFKAISGFHSRMQRSTLRFPPGFGRAVERYAKRRMREEAVAR